MKHKHVIFGLLRHLKQQALGRLLTESGEPDKEIIDKLVRGHKKFDLSFTDFIRF